MNALAAILQSLGGKIETGVEVKRLEDLPRARVVLLDVTPRQFVEIAGGRLPTRYRDRLQRFRYGPGVFKIDYALKDPIPWSNEICRRAGTVHTQEGLCRKSPQLNARWLMAGIRNSH